MSFFEQYFNEYDFSKNETAVCCPFPHHTSQGLDYYESNPSAHINIEKGLYHCKVCGEGKSEVAFIAEVLGCNYETAIRIQSLFRADDETVYSWDTQTRLTETISEQCNKLGINDSVIKELNIATESGDEISFPVFLFDKLIDVRSYRPGCKPKIKSRRGKPAGLIIPYDIWRESDKNKWTLICAGEKDMAVARSNGFNAITITGGERALPLFLNCFKDRKIAICYDNDDAGISGAKFLAAHLFPVAQEVKVVTGFHSVCTETGEDITDFFMKYKGTKAQLVSYIKDTEPFTPHDVQELKDKIHPFISLIEATQPQYINRVVRSNIQVVATFDNAFVTPTTIVAKKINAVGDTRFDHMYVGEERSWYLGEDTAGDVLKLIDNNFTEEQIRLNTREILKISKLEKEVSISKPTKETVHKCCVTDLFEVNTKDAVQIEFTAYAIKKKLESGKKYKATYKLVPHPYKGQSLTMIILDVEDATDSITNFTITDAVKQNLSVIRDLKGTVKERVDLITEKVKGVLGYDGYNQIIQCFDLAYHTVLEFNFGTFKNVRGYLDTLIVAESRVGKSTTAEALQKLYSLGTFTSLAGNSATIAGLVGGSNKVNGSFQTRAGLIPQNHRGLVIFEELAKSSGNIMRELTDIKSSNQVRITRVNGNLNLPAMVRMITLTNVKGGSEGIRSITSYPNGIEILIDLIGTPEDIARFDLMLVFGARGNRNVDPYWTPEEPFKEQVYKDRVRWVWSRDAEHVIIPKEVGIYVMEQCNKLNELYDSYIKIFGTEAWKKVTRLAIAVAGYLVSTDDSFENIIVEKEHVDFAIQFLINLYDNETFRLKEYVEQERKYNSIDSTGIDLLQEIYIGTPSLLLHLSQNSVSNRNNLMGATGLKPDDFNAVMNRMVRGLFVRYQGYDIVPTERFRLGMNRINRNTTVTRVGEENVL